MLHSQAYAKYGMEWLSFDKDKMETICVLYLTNKNGEL